MKGHLIIWWDSLRNSFWFKPSIMAVCAIALSFGVVTIDDHLTRLWLKSVTWIYSGGVDGARAVLQTVAGSMITIAGTVFSLTLVALSIASSQFGSRLLRNFMRDSINQTVLGTFTATFLYCLMVLRTIRSESEGGFVPHVAVTLGVILALASLWMLIYFIHHVAVSIQADEVVARVSDDLNEAIERLFPEGATPSVPAAEGDPPVLPDCSELPIPAAEDGYLQRIDLERLLVLAHENNLVLHLDRRPGHYLVAGTALGTARAIQALPLELIKEIQKTFFVGNQRTMTQDVEFGILQLVEIAVRALSPGINDPFTAIACVDRLGSILARLAQRTMPAAYRYGSDGSIRLIADCVTFISMADAAMNQLRQYARDNADVTIRLLETIAVVVSVTPSPADRDALRRQAEMISAGAEHALPEAQDRSTVKMRYGAVLRAIQLPPYNYAKSVTSKERTT
jgi:uncharacterized membrane protein